MPPRFGYFHQKGSPEWEKWESDLQVRCSKSTTTVRNQMISLIRPAIWAIEILKKPCISTRSFRNEIRGYGQRSSADQAFHLIIITAVSLVIPRYINLYRPGPGGLRSSRMNAAYFTLLLTKKILGVILGVKARFKPSLTRCSSMTKVRWEVWSRGHPLFYQPKTGTIWILRMTGEEDSANQQRGGWVNFEGILNV